MNICAVLAQMMFAVVLLAACYKLSGSIFATNQASDPEDAQGDS